MFQKYSCNYSKVFFTIIQSAIVRKYSAMVQNNPRGPWRIRLQLKGPSGLGYGKEVGQVRLGYIFSIWNDCTSNDRTENLFKRLHFLKKIFDQSQLNYRFSNNFICLSFICYFQFNFSQIFDDFFFGVIPLSQTFTFIFVA